MEGLVAFLLSASLAFVPVRPQAGASSDVWKATWKDLDRLEESAPGSPERLRLWRALDGFQADRERAARKAHDRVEVLRARILHFHLVRLGGATLDPIAESSSNIEFLPGEAWLALQALGPGPTRARAAGAALAEAGGANSAARSERVRQVAEEDARDLHLEWALEEARSLHERAGAPRTAILLARILRLSGEYDSALEVLDETLARGPVRADRADLSLERARAHAAAGADALAVTDLGSALASGSREAGLRLGLRALLDGEPARARSLFRSLTGAPEGNPLLPAALRGYGLALLARNGPNSLAVDPDPQRNPAHRPN